MSPKPSEIQCSATQNSSTRECVAVVSMNAINKLIIKCPIAWLLLAVCASDIGIWLKYDTCNTRSVFMTRNSYTVFYFCSSLSSSLFHCTSQHWLGRCSFTNFDFFLSPRNPFTEFISKSVGNEKLLFDITACVSNRHFPPSITVQTLSSSFWIHKNQALTHIDCVLASMYGIREQNAPKCILRWI